MKHLILLTSLGLFACADPHQPLSPDFGNAVKANIAAQVVNPQPAMTGPNMSDGQRIGNAMDRYRTNKVYKPQMPIMSGQGQDQQSNQQQ
jgi:type IV pilus biogenesis protein CpaD/CtpE